MIPRVPKKLRLILERFDVDAMKQPEEEVKTLMSTEGGDVPVLSYEECAREQKSFLDTFAFSSFRPTYTLTDLHREKEAGLSLIDIPPRGGIRKITITPAPFDHIVIRVGAENTLLIMEESFPQDTPGIGSIELTVDQGSKVDYVLLEKKSVSPRILVRSAVLERNARLDWHPHFLGDTASVGAGLKPTPTRSRITRHPKPPDLQSLGARGWRRMMLDLHTLLGGEGSQSNLFGTYLGREDEEYYLTYESTHRGARSGSNMIVHGCLMERSVGIFNGQATIEQTGHETTTFVGERCLLLGNQARHGSTPALSVNTNDVRAGHSSATSQIDEEQLFYASSRGLPKEEAVTMIVNGFLQTMLDRIPSAVRIDLPENLLKESQT